MANTRDNPYKEFSDRQVWSLLKEQDKFALSFFFTKYYSLLFNYGLKISHDEVLVEDVIQEVFFKIWSNCAKYSDVQNPKAYILRAFRNSLLDRVNSFKKLERLDKFEFIHETESIQERIMEDERQAEVRHRLDIELDKLPARQREIIYLKFYRDLDYEEIADVLGINYQSVRNSVHTSIKKLRKTAASIFTLLVGLFF